MRLAFFYAVEEKEESAIVGKVATIFRDNEWSISGAACDSSRQNVLNFIELNEIVSASLFIGLITSQNVLDGNLVRSGFQVAVERKIPAILLIETQDPQLTGFREEKNIYYFNRNQSVIDVVTLNEWRSKIQTLVNNNADLLVKPSELAWILAGGAPAQIVKLVSEMESAKTPVMA